MKRICIWLLVAAMTLAFPVVSVAEGSGFTVDGQNVGDVPLVPGGEFTYEVSMQNNPGIVVAAMMVKWPETDFKLKEVTFGEIMPNNGSPAVGGYSGEYPVSLGNDTAAQNYIDDGVLFTMTFEILEKATSGTKEISLEYCNSPADFLDFSMTAVDVEFNAGSVTLTDVTQTVYGEIVPKVKLAAGRTFDYKVSLKDNLGIVAGAVKVTWPAADLILTGLQFGMMPDNGTPAISSMEAGTCSVTFGSDTALTNYTEDGVLFTMTFEVTDAATEGEKAVNITFLNNADDFVNFNNGTVPTSFEAGSITLLPAVGYTVSGTVVSYGDAANETTIAVKSGDTVVNSCTVTGNSATYTLEEIEDGEYTIEVSKLNHVTRTYSITVDSGDLTQDLKICLLGDVTMDGRVNITDVNRLYSHVRKTSLITDEYSLACGNVIDAARINITDVNRLYSHVRKINPLY